MKPWTPQRLAGLFLIGHAVVTVAVWCIFVFITSAVDDTPLNRLLLQFSSPESRPFFTVEAALFVGVSLVLAAAFFAPFARHKHGALALTALVALHAVGNLALVGVPPFVYLTIVCLIAYRGVQHAPQPTC